LLKEGRREGTVDIIHVAMVDLNGVFAMDLLGRIAAIKRFTGIIEFSNRKSEESERGRISSGVFDVFSGFKKKIMGGKDKKMLEDGGSTADADHLHNFSGRSSIRRIAAIHQ